MYILKLSSVIVYGNTIYSINEIISNTKTIKIIIGGIITNVISKRKCVKNSQRELHTVCSHWVVVLA